MKQPRLTAFDMEFFGIAKTATGEIWWHEELEQDGTIKRIPLQPHIPIAESCEN